MNNISSRRKSFGIAVGVLFIGVLSSCKPSLHQADVDSEQVYAASLGKVAPDGFASIPDWTMNRVRSCYAEALRADPQMEGDVVFAIQPPEQTGPVRTTIISSDRLSDELLLCVRSALGSIHHYAERGRKQSAVADTLRFSRRTEHACLPPSSVSMTSILSNRYDSTVVKVVGAKVARMEHRADHFNPDMLLRHIVLDVELVFTTSGYEGRCYHGGEYKVFSAERVEPWEGHVCQNLKRRKGARVRDSHALVFALRNGQWWDVYERKAYCGDKLMLSSEE